MCAFQSRVLNFFLFFPIIFQIVFPIFFADPFVFCFSINLLPFVHAAVFYVYFEINYGKVDNNCVATSDSLYILYILYTGYYMYFYLNTLLHCYWYRIQILYSSSYCIFWDYFIICSNTGYPLMISL